MRENQTRVLLKTVTLGYTWLHLNLRLSVTAKNPLNSLLLPFFLVFLFLVTVVTLKIRKVYMKIKNRDACMCMYRVFVIFSVTSVTVLKICLCCTYKPFFGYTCSVTLSVTL